MARDRRDFSIVLCGEAGMGIQTVELLLTRILKFSGYNVFATKEYMSRIRGGANSTEIRVSSDRVSAFVDRIDILIPLDKGAAHRLAKRISPKTLVLGEKENAEDLKGRVKNLHDIRFTDIAKEIGSPLYVNTVATGVVAGLFSVEKDIMSNFLHDRFASKGDKVVNENIEAARRGYQIGEELRTSGKIKAAVKKTAGVENELLVSGAEAVAIGAIAGGCNFISAYPMSPSTGVLVFLAQQSREFDIVAEQAEDEIAAMNLAIAAWYAGARAMVTTSGGGFALMGEGVSLAGMLETPVVVHLAQRPGPATGLPTRTEQGDLELVLYGGHGEFPRIVLTPGTLEEAFRLTQKAFNLADKFQVPVFVLTDQHLIDSYYNIPSLDLSKIKVEKHFVKTDKAYKRYQLTRDGLSPRGIPGHGKGLVVGGSDEHDEEGHISEDLELRTKMVEKRLKKLGLIKKDVVPPELVGPKNFRTLILGWGSTYNVIKEALAELGKNDVSFLHFKQVFPLPAQAAQYLKKARRTVVIENNATSQLAKLIKLSTGIDVDKRILKYNGLPFSVEEVVAQLKKMIRQ
jgi:2-oxoglutarate ferredoxin oxidoreductase subunit alpha